MFRRSRFSVQPKVTGKSRAAAAPQEAPPTNQEATETTTTTASDSSKTSAVTEIPSAVTQSTPAASGEVNDQNVDSTSSSAALQRRKRFSVKPKVAPGRPSTQSRTPKSPIKPVLETPAEVPSSDLDKPSTSDQNESQELQSPQRPSEESTQLKVQSDTTPGSSELPAVAGPEASLQKTGKQLESQVTDISSRPPVKAQPSLPDKETDEISEKAKTLVSSKSGLSISASASSLSKLLNDPSDLQRLAKAQKLRELLREEKHKERKLRKSKCRGKEYSLDPAKMTMRDLIHYLPMSNPMKSSITDMAPENETVVPSSPGREEPLESAQEPQAPQNDANPTVEDEDGDVEEVEDEEQEDSIMVPQVKVAEDGSLIIDEESLTVEVQRTKGPNTTQDRDPIFERGSTTTYSSFRTLKMAKPWSAEETDMFYLAISMVGTDFSMICQLFPLRSRTEIKNKFKKEERENCWRIDKAFRDKRKLDIEYFSKLLEKILEFQKNKKKLRAITQKNAPKKSQRREKGKKKKSKKLTDIEEEDENEDDDEVLDLEDEEEGGEKENDNLANEDETSFSKPKRQQKRKTEQDDLNEEPNNNKKKRAAKGETSIPEHTEAALPENHTSTETSDDVTPTKDTPVKPVELSRMRVAKPLLPLGRKWGKKPPLPSTRPEESMADEENENVCDGASDQVNKESSPVKQAGLEQSAEADVSSEEEYATVQPPRPTRYGRMPKPTKPLTYSAKEAEHSDAPAASSVDTAASNLKSKPKCSTKRGRTSKQQSAQESKKPKLVTLRASQLQYSDDEEETQLEDHEEPEREVDSEDGTACVFVPASLRSPPPVIAEVEETMEELDILANMPDVLGISQDALCHDVSWDKAQNQTGTAEPCEHQLDLLVDVIDYLSSEQTEVCEDEGYNEAAQTLLTISNMMHLPQTAENQSAAQDDVTDELPECSRKPRPHIDLEESSETAVNSSDGVSQTPEPSNQLCGVSKTVDDTDCSSQIDPSPEESEKHSPQPRKVLPKLKPKPNLAVVSMTAQPQSQPDNISEPTEHKEDSNTRPVHCPPSETLSSHEEVSEITDSPSVFAPSSDTKSTVSPPKNPSANKESKMTNNELVEQMYHVLPTTRLSVSEEQTLPDIPFEPNISDACLSSAVLEKREPTQDESESHGNLVESDSLVTVLPTGQNTSEHPASCDLSFSKKEGDEAELSPGGQLRRSRSQKVKPVPNIPGTLGTTRSRTPVVEERDESDSSVNKTSQSTSLSAVVTSPNSPCEATTELSCMGDEQVQCETSVDAMSFLGQSESKSHPQLTNQDVGSTLATTDDKGLSHSETSGSCSLLGLVSTADQDLGLVQEISEHAVTQKESPVTQQVESEVKSAVSSRRSRFPRVQPRIPQTSRSKLQTKKDSEENDSIAAPILSSPKKSNQSVISTSNLPPANNLSPTEEVDRSLAMTKLQAGQELIPLQESSEHRVTVAVDRSEAQMKFDSDKTGSQAEEVKSCGEAEPHVGQKEENKVTSPCTSRRRSQKVKPKVNIPQTSRPSKLSPKKAKDVVEIESNPASVSEQGEILTSSENETSLGSGSLSVSIPSLDVGSTLTNEQPSTAELERADEKIVGRTCAVGSPLGHYQSENHSLSDVLFEHSRRNTETASEKAKCRDATSESSNNKVTFDTASARSNRGENVPPIQEKLRNLDAEVATVSQMEESDALQDVTQSKPTCSKHRMTDSTQDVVILPEKQSEGADTDSASASVQSVELSTSDKPTLLTVKPKSELGLESTTDSPKASVPQRRRYFPKVKPNLVSSPRRISTTQRQRNSTDTSDEQPVGIPQIQVERTDKNTQIKGANSPSVEGSTGESAITEANERLDSTGDMNTSSSGISIATPFIADILKKSVTEHKVSEVSSRERGSTDGEISNNIKVEAGCSRTPPADDSTTALGFLSSKEPHASSIQDKEEVGPSSQSSQSELHCSSKPTSKAPQTRRGRLMKPTPNLGRSRSLQPQNQRTTQDVKDTGAVSVHRPVPEVQPNIQESVKENIPSSSAACLPLDGDSMLVRLTETDGQQNEHDPSVDVTFLGCETQEVDISQITPTVTLVERTPQCSTVFPALTTEQLPSDPDEPFFILSLTEIPVSSSAEMMDTTVETHHYVGDTFTQQQSRDSGQPVAVPVEESPLEDVIKENPLNTQGSTVQPSTSPETEDNMNIAEFSSKTETKQRSPRPPRRAAKLQVKPDTTRTRGSRTLRVDINQDSDLPQFSMQPQVSVDNRAELDRPGSGPGDDVSEAEIKTENMKTRKSTNGDPLPGRATSSISKVKTEQSTSIPVASTSQTVASCSHVTKQPGETSTTLTTSSLEESVQQTTEHSQLCSDVLINKQSCPEHIEEESTTVSEYFFSDIFTPVEED
ncbi:transcription factor TFIIIB component B'' homolog isoform X5 [Cynoglossus semilaevis]|uniref:transcription factor TFIIIB component B'' homolog isoform X5 n=1 Tax=Cynoglossus semilaevis TaxID=244447 RepID=UPI0007DC84C0|nr:transcription factor TFIIIB component B'' homolog isoform X5 [Cynoglossus semilaevis]